MSQNAVINSPGQLALINAVENGLHPKLTNSLNGLIRDVGLHVAIPNDPPRVEGNHLVLAIKRDWAEVEEGRVFVQGWIDRAVEELKKRLIAAESLRYNTAIRTGEDPLLDCFFLWVVLAC